MSNITLFSYGPLPWIDLFRPLHKSQPECRGCRRGYHATRHDYDVGHTRRINGRYGCSNNNFIHPMHIHGGPFTIVATDGNPLPDAMRFEKDTVNVAPGERYDVLWTAREPGKWLIHCHIPHHITNNNVEEDGAGGLTILSNVS